MRNGEIRTAGDGGSALEKVVTDVAGGLFEIQTMLRGDGRDIGFLLDDRNTQMRAERGSPFGILRRRPRAHAMVEVRGREFESIPLSQLMQPTEQGDAIGASRNTHQNA